MQKATLTVLILLLAVSVTGLVLFYFESNSDTRMGHGAHSGSATQNYDLLWLAIFVIPLIGALIIIVFSVFFPKNRTQQDQIVKQIEIPPDSVNKDSALQAVLRVLNPDEKKIIEILASAQGGSMLQKEIRWKTGLTRVQTHRILMRLLERKIISIEKHYNTNKVTLAEWVTRNEPHET
jgi:uncharacterized membrane protein